MCLFCVVGAHLFVGFCGLALCFDIKELLVIVYVVSWAKVFIGMEVCAWLCVDIVSTEDSIVGGGVLSGVYGGLLIVTGLVFVRV